jgi:hypothetical protein
MWAASCEGGVGLAGPEDFTGAEDTDALRRRARREVVRLLRVQLERDERELARLRDAAERTAARVENVRGWLQRQKDLP